MLRAKIDKMVGNGKVLISWPAGGPEGSELSEHPRCNELEPKQVLQRRVAPNWRAVYIQASNFSLLSNNWSWNVCWYNKKELYISLGEKCSIDV